MSKQIDYYNAFYVAGYHETFYVDGILWGFKGADVMPTPIPAWVPGVVHADSATGLMYIPRCRCYWDGERIIPESEVYAQQCEAESRQFISRD